MRQSLSKISPKVERQAGCISRLFEQIEQFRFFSARHTYPHVPDLFTLSEQPSRVKVTGS